MSPAGDLSEGPGLAEAMPDTGPLTMSRADAQAMVRHAQREAPHEACGLLAGESARITQVYPLTNVDHSPTTYRLDPGEQYRTFLEIERRGWEVVGVYHSHTHTAAYPSPTDIRYAHYPEGAYLIVSLALPEQPCLRGFRIAGGEVKEIELHISED